MRVIFIFLFLLGLIGCSNQAEIITNQTETKNNDNSEIVVEIKGAVKFPGLYVVDEGIMLYEVLNLAGGLLSSADVYQINLVQTFSNNSSISIPFKNNDLEISTLININYATLEELLTLEGIGQAKAQAIISYRKNNFFTSIEDIMKVSGIGEEVFSKIKDNITV